MALLVSFYQKFAFVDWLQSVCLNRLNASVRFNIENCERSVDSFQDLYEGFTIQQITLAWLNSS